MRKFESYKDAEQFATRAVEALANQFPGAVAMADGDGRLHGLIFPKEEAFTVHYRIQEHRFVVSGCWPRSRLPGEESKQFSPSDLWNPRAEYPSITVDADKSPEQIAADIKRRFLAKYRPVLARCVEARDNHEQHVKRCNMLAEEIATLLGQSSREHPSKSHSPLHPFVDLPDGLGFGSIEVSNDSVHFDLHSVSVDKARKLAAFLKTL
ncbi:MAG TPA: hypothetical protein VN578_21175 [Candidatus Binatia bacterium]|jgi:hypothetical protein|nr:hypothetical protein [Candidatus Binatia bacterium]